MYTYMNQERHKQTKLMFFTKDQKSSSLSLRHPHVSHLSGVFFSPNELLPS